MIQLKCRNLSRRVELTWIDPYINWKKTLIYIKEYDGLPIWRIENGVLIYESLKENQHESVSYRLDNLKNGKNYQIGIFPVTKDNIICLSPVQLIAQPRYIRPKQVINGDYLNFVQTRNTSFMINNNYSEQAIEESNIDIEESNIDIEEFSIDIEESNIDKKEFNIDKEIYMYDGKIDIGLFTWENNSFITHKNTVFWFEALYPLVEGGKLKFVIDNDKPCLVKVYIDRLNIFTLTEDRRHVYYSFKDVSFKDSLFISDIENNVDNDNSIDNTCKNNMIMIDIPAREYCKIIIEVKSEYKDFTIQLSDIELTYNTGE